ncbi:MAG: hypothetical protein KDB32_08880 [Planctomycetes bacterium]|nr:hypothetical protein [Planctomycetota bacterium]
MSFLPYIVLSGLAIVLTIGVGAIALMGVDVSMMRGVGAGVTAGLSLMVFSWFTTLKGLRAGERKNTLGHVLGGFGLRFVVLVGGFGLLAITRWGNPAGFAVAFLMAVMTYLALQILIVMRTLDKPEITAA